MALKIGDRVRENTSSTGVGGLSLTGAPAGFQRFSAVLASGDVTYYSLEENDKFEVGIGTYGSNNLERTTVLSSSNSGDKISLGGSGVVFITYPADKALFTDVNDQFVLGASGLLFANGTTVKEAKLVELTDVNLSGTPTQDTVFDLNITNKSLSLGDMTGATNTNNVLIGFGAASGITNAQHNVVIGSESSGMNKTGSRNVYVGSNSGPSDASASTSTYESVAVGCDAGNLIRQQSTVMGYTAGASSYEIGFTAIGYQAGTNVGSYSTTMGYQAGTNLTSDYSVCLGYRAGYNSAGASSIWIGRGAGTSASSSTNSIGIGFDAGKSSSATESIYIGESAGESNSVDNLIFIGNASPSSNGTLIKGDMSNKRVAIGAADVTLDDTLFVGINSATDEGVVVKGHAAQSANLTSWKNNSDGVLAAVSPNGVVSANVIHATGNGILIDSVTPASTSNKLYNVGSDLYWNGSIITAAAVASIANYASGQSIENEGDIVAVSGIASAASGIAAYASGVSLTVKEADGTPNVSNVRTIVVSNGTLTDDSNGQVTITTGGGGGGGSSLTAGSGITIDDLDRINVHGGSGHFVKLNVESDNANSVASTIKATAGQAADLQQWQDNTELVRAKVDNVGNFLTSGNITSASGQIFLQGGGSPVTGPTLCFTGSSNKRLGLYEKLADNQLSFCAGGRNRIILGVDRLKVNNESFIGWSSSSVGEAEDGTDLALRRESSGVMSIRRNKATSGPSLGEIIASGVSASGIELVNHVPASTTNRLYNEGGTLKFNGSAVGGGGGGGDVSTAQLNYVSGIAVYSSGLAISNEAEVTYASGLAISNEAEVTYASGLAITNEGRVNYASGLAITNETRVNYASGQAIENESDIAAVSGVAYNIFNIVSGDGNDYIIDGMGLGNEADPDIYLHKGHSYTFNKTFSGHPFRVSATEGGSVYQDADGNNIEIGSSPAEVRFEVPQDAPDKLHYYCTSHPSNMKGIIYTTNNVDEIIHVSGIAAYASGLAITNEGRVNYASGLAITNELNVAYASGQAIENEGLATYASGNTQNIAFGSNAEGDILIHDGSKFTRLAKGTDNYILKMNGNLPNWEAESGGSSLTAGSGVVVDGADRINIHGGTGNLQEIQLTSDNIFTPKMVFTGSGVQDTPITMKVLSSHAAVNTSGTALSFEGTQGQLFGITDNLSSGNIFSVADITGLPLISADASGDVRLGEYGRFVGVGTGVPLFGLDVSSSGQFQKGITLSDYLPATTTNALYNDGSVLKFNGLVVSSDSVPASDTPTTEDATITLDLSTGNYHNVILGNNVTKFEFLNAKRGQRFLLRITQHAGSAKTIAWTDVDYTSGGAAATVRWPGGTAPTMSTSTSHTDVYGFLCTNNAGSAFDGFIVGQDLPD